MTRSRLPLIAVAAIALATAGPAAAISGYPLAGLTGHTVAKTKAKSAHTCQAGHSKQKVRVANPTNLPVVACEFPPRSQLSGPSLAKSAASTLATYG